MTPTETQLETELYRTCDTAQSKGYSPTFFRQMLGERGGVGTVRRLLATGDEQAQTGLTRLYGLELLAISAEAVMLKPAYESLFTDAERAVARSRLALFGYRPAWDTVAPRGQ